MPARGVATLTQESTIGVNVVTRPARIINIARNRRYIALALTMNQGD